jgi:hypothetical protein
MSKVKVIKQNIETQELNVMLEQILDEKGDPEIVLVKRKDMVNCIQTCIKLFSHLTQKDGLFRKIYKSSYDSWLKEIEDYSNQCQEMLNKKLEYLEMKDNNLVKRLMFVCRELKPFVFYIENQGTESMKSFGYKGAWINEHPGHVLEPFPFSKFNLKAIWMDTSTDDRMKKYLLTIIKMIFVQCTELYKLISTPDIDISNFSKVIVEAIQKIKKVPELSRCGDAFKKLEESVDMLEGNFGGYYKDMLQSQNPTMLIVNFIEDVSKSDKMDIKLVYQFRQIVSYYKKATQGKIKDPAIKEKFELLSKRFSMLDGQISGMTGMNPEPDNEEKADDSSDTEDEEPGATNTPVSESEEKSEHEESKIEDTID